MSSYRFKVREFLIKSPPLFDRLKRLSLLLNRDKETDILRKLVDRNTHLMQLGANDGIRNDPIRAHIFACKPRKSVLFEPNPAPYQELVRAYSYLIDEGYNIKLINAACTPSEAHELNFLEINEIGKRHLTPDQQRAVARKGGIDSENLKQYLKEVSRSLNLIGSQPVESWIKKSKVKAINIDQYLTDTDPVTLLAIDTEGLDWDLISAISSSNLPKYIMWEYGNPNNSTILNVTERLQELGYKIIYSRRNVFALPSDFPEE